MSWQTDYAFKSVMLGFGALLVFALTAGTANHVAAVSYLLALVCIMVVPLALDVHEEYC